MFSLFSPLFTRFAAACGSDPTFFGLVPWYHYLPKTTDVLNNCVIGTNHQASFNALGAQSGFLLIGLAILDDLIRIAAFVAVGYVIYSGITYTTSQGVPDQTKKAQQTLINALIGLSVAIIAAALVSFIGNKLGG